MSDLSWREAIEKVLTQQGTALSYTDIADYIAEQGLRSSLGATPAQTVNSIITTSIKNDGASSPFVRVARGQYSLSATAALGGTPSSNVTVVNSKEESAEDETGLINAFGMYWSRQNVYWITTPRILGQQQTGTTQVDFCQQRGVYLLHDGHSVVYVGRTTDQPLGVRLRQHINDRLNGRWDRFSWFGIYSVNEDGTLDVSDPGHISVDSLIVTMEALLIEGLEPPQNRKRGDDFRAAEFLQLEDPEIQKSQILALMDELKKKL